MDKKLLIVRSICAVVLLVMTSLSNVVGYQTVQSSNQSVIKERINQRELLFQTIVDMANNKEIQRIILKSQMSKGIFPTSEFPVVTKNQIKQMYFIGLILSKVIDKSKLFSLMKQYQMIPSSDLQEQLTAIIEKDKKLSGEISQLSNSNCQCESQNIKNQGPPLVICGILLILICVPGFFVLVFSLLGTALLKIRENVESLVVEILCLFCGYVAIFWLPIFFAIGMMILGAECLGPYPPYGL